MYRQCGKTYYAVIVGTTKKIERTRYTNAINIQFTVNSADAVSLPAALVATQV